MIKKFNIIILCFVVLLSSCEIADTVEQKITYPDTLYYGKNVLSLPDSSFLTDTGNYELGAELEKDAKLRLVLFNFSIADSGSSQKSMWAYKMGQAGWIISTYDYNLNKQVFTSTQSGKLGAEMKFIGIADKGKCRIDVYENGDMLTLSKYLFW